MYVCVQRVIYEGKGAGPRRTLSKIQKPRAKEGPLPRALTEHINMREGFLGVSRYLYMESHPGISSFLVLDATQTHHGKVGLLA